MVSGMGVHLRKVTSAASSPLYDVVVIGGGHAGTEAATAAARMGVRVALVTHKRASIGAMSCNPSIGGIGKGHLVREIDAFHGVMPRAADCAAIQFRTLNASRGAAVHGPRAQIDRKLYRSAVLDILSDEEHRTLDVIEGAATEFLLDTSPSRNAVATVAGVTLDGGERGISQVRAGAVVLTTGTFLNGRLLVGNNTEPGGRRGDEASVSIAAALRNYGLQLGRMKTGTPPRLWRRTVDTSGLLEEGSDDQPMFFSFLTDEKLHQTKFRSHGLVSCFQTRTNLRTHALVREAVAKGYGPKEMCTNGPRYCPSLEAKVTRFGDRDGHVVWLEPEGLGSDLIYPAGISMSLPQEVQQNVVNSIDGLERAEIAVPGYAVEYDFVHPTELQPNLETFRIDRLFLAGQINGTTGYEEAAAQGVIAGINAAVRSCKTDLTAKEAWAAAIDRAEVDANSLDVSLNSQFGRARKYVQLSRSDAYIGVLLNDLTKVGTDEPYRMLTSRAEWRLRLRADCADVRLTPIGRAAGCVPDERWNQFMKKRKLVVDIEDKLRQLRLKRSEWERRGLREAFHGWKRKDDAKQSAWHLLQSANVLATDVLFAVQSDVNGIDTLLASPEAVRHLVASCQYEPALARQEEEVRRIKQDALLDLDSITNFENVFGLSIEDREKLSAQRPQNLGLAAQIPGVSAAGIALVRAHLRRARSSKKRLRSKNVAT